GIRDWSVTGVQTCALPIYRELAPARIDRPRERPRVHRAHESRELVGRPAPIDPAVLLVDLARVGRERRVLRDETRAAGFDLVERSEERRVGKESRSRWWGD